VSFRGNLIVNAALTGMVPRKPDNPWVPITPDEIADDAVRVVAAGASIVHLHARDEDGSPSYRREVYAEIIAKIRDRCPDVIVCVSTSGRVFRSFAERSDVLDLKGDVKPDMASLTLGSLNFPKQAVTNDPETIRRLAERMAERGIVPELEVFDLGMVDYANYLVDRGILRGPHYFNILLGSLGTLAASPLNLALVVQALPAGSTWAAAGIGRYQFSVNAMAVTMGGHIRVGLEDNLFMGTKERPATNLALVERIVTLGRAFEREPATPGEARTQNGLAAGAVALRSSVVEVAD
jgi:3-keto-5-aminohexanoate cleavage enzyme